MIVGILSDTHDRVDAMSAGMSLLAEKRAEFFIHCGDVGGEGIIDLLAGKSAAFVWGNNDHDRAALARYSQSLAVNCLGEFGELTLGGKSFAIIHGDDDRLYRRLISEQRHDYLLHGHTHVRRDERVGTMRVINPGALHRASPKTVAVLDTATDQLEFFNVNVPRRG